MRDARGLRRWAASAGVVQTDGDQPWVGAQRLNAGETSWSSYLRSMCRLRGRGGKRRL